MKTKNEYYFSNLNLIILVISIFIVNLALELLNWWTRIRVASFPDALRVRRVCTA